MSLVKCKNLKEYIQTLSPQILARLYMHPAACLTIFRELPVIAQHYVMRLLFIEQPVFRNLLCTSIQASDIEKNNEAEKALTSLHIWMEKLGVQNLPGWLLSASFRKGLQTAYMGSNFMWGLQEDEEDLKNRRDIAFLDKHAQDHWDYILHFMVGTQNSIPPDTSNVLVHSDLMRLDRENTTSHSITKDGFQFLLMDICSQVWYFMLQYLNTVESKDMDLVECLTFLFQLSLTTLGKSYSIDGLSESALKMVQHLREFGLLFQRKRKSKRIYPTRLAINLASGLKGGSISADQPGFLIVETNYFVTAYTDSSLKLALLTLFCQPTCRFPNMMLGTITRDSVRQALKNGITADQIINFLKMHAHPESRKSKESVPLTVLDQIKLWEKERNRVNYQDCVLYSQFLSQGDYELLRNYARSRGYLVWENDARRFMTVSKEGHDDVRKFWKRNKE